MDKIEEVLEINKKVIGKLFPGYETGFDDLFRDVVIRLEQGEHVSAVRGEDFLSAVGREPNLKFIIKKILLLICAVGRKVENNPELVETRKELEAVIRTEDKRIGAGRKVRGELLEAMIKR